METTNQNTSSKRRQDLNRLGFNFVNVTRVECEESRPDYTRFHTPSCYMTEEELKYFKSDEQRELFKKMFWPKND